VGLLIPCSQEHGGSNPPPRAFLIKFKSMMIPILLLARRKTQKIIRSGPKNATTGMCPECKTIGRIFIIGQVGQERAKCQKCNKEFEL